MNETNRDNIIELMNEITRLKDEINRLDGEASRWEEAHDYEVKLRGMAADEIERLRGLLCATQAAVDGSMRDIWIAMREPEKSGMSIDHALGHLAQSLAPLRREVLGE